MNSFNKFNLAAVITLMIAAVPLSAVAQDPFQILRQYDPQDRKALIAIRKQIQDAGLDKAKQAAIETGLIAVLDDANGNLPGKQEAAKFLWIIGSGKSVTSLAKMLGKPETNDIARYALEHNTDPSAALALRTALKSAKGVELVGIINSIGDRADTGAVDSLKPFVKNSDSMTADAAITALGKIGTFPAVKILGLMNPQTLATENALLRCIDKMVASGDIKGAQRDFQILTDQTLPVAIRAGGLTGLWNSGSQRTSTIALSIAKSAPEFTLQRTAARIAVMSASPADNLRAISAWPTMPAPSQIAMLNAWADRGETSASSVAMTAIKSDDVDVRIAGIRSSIKLCGSTVVPTLAEIASGGDQANVARESLAMMSGSGVEAALISLAKTGKIPVRNTVINILSNRVTPVSTTALLEIAASQDASPSTTALKALGKTAGVDQEAKLVQILVGANDDGVRDAAQTAIVAIAQRGGDANRGAEPLISAFAGANSAGKASLLTALSEMGGDRALQLLTESTHAKVLSVKAAAIAALSNTWTDSRALPTLLELSKSSADKADRIQTLRGYFRIVAADDRAGDDVRLSRVKAGLTNAERVEDKRQALSVLRNIRTTGAIELAAKSLGDSELVNEAADTVIYLASPHRRGNNTVPAVTGDSANRALDQVIRLVKDDNLKAQAQKLRNG